MCFQELKCNPATWCEFVRLNESRLKIWLFRQSIWIISHLLHLFFFPGDKVNRGEARRTSCCETFPLFTAHYAIHSPRSIKPAVLMCCGSKLVTNSTIGNINILNVYHTIGKCPPSLSVRNKEIESFVILNCPSVAMNQSNILLWRASTHKNAGKIREGLNDIPHPVGIVLAQDSTSDHHRPGLLFIHLHQTLKRARIGPWIFIVFQILYTVSNSHKFHWS